MFILMYFRYAYNVKTVHKFVPKIFKKLAYQISKKFVFRLVLENSLSVVRLS